MHGVLQNVIMHAVIIVRMIEVLVAVVPFIPRDIGDAAAISMFTVTITAAIITGAFIAANPLIHKDRPVPRTSPVSEH